MNTALNTFPIELNAKTAAVLVRKMLKAKLHGTKFSVRSSFFAGGSSVDVSWEDGVALDVVEALINPMRGKGFDAMTDSTTINNGTFEVDGQTYKKVYCWFGTHRRISEATYAKVEAQQADYYGDWASINRYEQERRIHQVLRTTSF